MKIPLVILATLTATAADLTTNLTTNRSKPDIISVLQTVEIPGLCPECTEPHPNHHMKQICVMESHNLIYLHAVIGGKTNIMLIDTNGSTNWVQTNIVYRLPGLWPTNSLPAHR